MVRDWLESYLNIIFIFDPDDTGIKESKKLASHYNQELNTNKFTTLILPFEDDPKSLIQN